MKSAPWSVNQLWGPFVLIGFSLSSGLMHFDVQSIIVYGENGVILQISYVNKGEIFQTTNKWCTQMDRVHALKASGMLLIDPFI